ncbi:MAG: DUF1848 domain-containing protein [Nitrospirota bacterium]
MKQIISASRRTDIPAYYSEWLIRRLKAGFVMVQQPFSQKYFPVSLQPETVGAIVLWSKNYSPLLPRLELIEQTTKNFFFHFTITGHAELESNAPDYTDAVKDFIFISKRYSPKQLVWRFDPICITDKLSFELHEERFLNCARLLKGHATRCFVSFVHPYKKVITNIKQDTNHALARLTDTVKKDFARKLASHAQRYGIRMHACCNDFLVSDTIGKASCINGHSLSELFHTPFSKQAASLRKECACTKSIDIGEYNTCPQGCVYCYATIDKKQAMTVHQRHNPDWNSLGGDIPETELTMQKKQASFPY